MHGAVCVSEHVMIASRDLSCCKWLDGVNAGCMPCLLQHTTDYRYKPDLVIHSKVHGMKEEPEVPGHHLEDAKAQ